MAHNEVIMAICRSFASIVCSVDAKIPIDTFAFYFFSPVPKTKLLQLQRKTTNHRMAPWVTKHRPI